MKEIYESGMNVPVYNWATNLEASAKEQAINLAKHSRIHHHVALMPDAHAGMGATIGSVFGTVDCVIPSAIGYDIGCGMCALETDLDSDFEFAKTVANAVARVIPVGFNGHAEKQEWWGFEYESKDPELTREIQEEAPYKLGTLGGGNHFIEFQHDDKGKMWIMIHSGSRNIGHKIATHYCRLAKELNPCDIDPALAHLEIETDEFNGYIEDMGWALSYALENRRHMMKKVLGLVSNMADYKDLSFTFDLSKMINIHHNYASFERHYDELVMMHRKGATLARKNAMGIIPGSMGTKSFIVRGLGNPESFYSCSHGAGRTMSRSQANKTISQEDVVRALNGVYVKAPGNIKDESPQAYKDISEVMSNQADLVEIVTELTPVAVVKG